MRFTNFLPICVLFTLSMTSMGHVYANEKKCAQNAFDVVGNNLKIDRFKRQDDGGRVVAESCRFWPTENDKDIQVTAFAFMPDAENQVGEAQKMIVISMINVMDKRVLYSYLWTIIEDAIDQIGPDSLQLAETPYQLSNKLAAVGLTIHSDGHFPDCGENAWGDKFSLFVPDGNTFKPVFNVDLIRQRTIHGCISTMSKNSVWESAELTMSVEKTSANGVYDLMLFAKITTDLAEPPDVPAAPRSEKYLIHFNGDFFAPEINAPWWVGDM